LNGKEKGGNAEKEEKEGWSIISFNEYMKLTNQTTIGYISSK